MAYCRFSSDNYQSDVYCYYSKSGYVVLVAKQKIVSDLPACPLSLMFVDGQPKKGTTPETMEAWRAQRKLHEAGLNSAVYETIGLPEDGKTVEFEEADDAIVYLTELRQMGYRIPQYAFDGLREDGEAEQLQNLSDLENAQTSSMDTAWAPGDENLIETSVDDKTAFTC